MQEAGTKKSFSGVEEKRERTSVDKDRIDFRSDHFSLSLDDKSKM
jgi:hypothetical protein